MPTNKPLEKSIENVLRKAVEEECGLCLKWVCPGHRGVPDRILLFPGGIIAFVELKRPGAKVKAEGLQEWWRAKIQSFGFRCYEISEADQATALAKQMSLESFYASLPDADPCDTDPCDEGREDWGEESGG